MFPKLAREAEYRLATKFSYFFEKLNREAEFRLAIKLFLKLAREAEFRLAIEFLKNMEKKTTSFEIKLHRTCRFWEKLPRGNICSAFLGKPSRAIKSSCNKC